MSFVFLTDIYLFYILYCFPRVCVRHLQLTS